MLPARSLRHALLLVALAGGPLAARLAVAQGAAASARAAVVLVVEEITAEMDEAALRKSIAAELRGPVIRAGDAGAREARGVLSVRVQKTELFMVFRPRSGSPVERRISLPEGRSERLAAVSLLAGNLARDESAELLASLRPPASSGAPAAPPSGSSARPDGPVAPGSPLVPPGGTGGPGNPAGNPAGNPVGNPPAAGTASGAPAASSSGAPAESAPVAASSAPVAEEAPALPAAPVTEPEPTGEGYCSVHGGEDHPVAASLFSPIEVPYGEQPGLTNFALSLAYGHIGGLYGLQLAPGAVRTTGDATGAQMSVGGWVGGRARGFFVGGFFHHIACDTRGVQISSFVASQKGNLVGAQLGGMVSLSQGSIKGVQLGSAVAVTRGEVRGNQAAVFHAEAGSIVGLQASLFSMTGALYGAQTSLFSLADQASGAQLGLVNMTGTLSGAQLGLLNLAGPVSGFQLGLLNIGGEMKGPQIGLVNIAQRQEGYSFGLLSLAGNTTLQGEAWASHRVEGAVGLRITTGLAYTSFTLVYDNSNGLDRIGGGIALGLHLPLGANFFTDLDFGYYALPVVGHRQSGDDDPKADHYEGDQKIRLMLGYELGKHLSVFAGPVFTARQRADSPDFHLLGDAVVGALF